MPSADDDGKLAVVRKGYGAGGALNNLKRMVETRQAFSFQGTVRKVPTTLLLRRRTAQVAIYIRE